MPTYLLFLLLAAASLSAGGVEFEPNAGQAESRFSYLSRASNTRVYLEDSALEFVEPSQMPVRFVWAGARSSQLGWTASESTGNTYRYCNQADPKPCFADVPSFRKLVRAELYRGIDWLVYGRDGDLEYDLVVHPGADVRSVRLRVEGALPTLGAGGRLRAGSVMQWQPEAYQWIDGKKVPVQAVLQHRKDGDFGFSLGVYRQDLDLIIDPVIQAVVVSGGLADDVTLGSFRRDGEQSIRYGLTRSGDWSRLPGERGRDVFIQETNSFGTRTVFWGGDGDEEIGGAAFDRNNSLLSLAGWTNSTNAPTFALEGKTREYAGGASDGFILEFAGRGIVYASYFGGPGADKLHDVRRLEDTSTRLFGFVGETDNTSWPGATVEKTGAGGRVDAIAGIVQGSEIRMAAIGGSGEDRAIRLRKFDRDLWLVAGETTSPEFAAAGQDLWVGRLQLGKAMDPGSLRLFGGSGNERFGGMEFFADEGIYLAGTTDSPSLPGSDGSHHGGDSDGFLARLDPQTTDIRSAVFLGGGGRDEIHDLTSTQGDLFLGGATDSVDLVLPGLNPAAGGLDGLFIHCDLLGQPLLGLRFGGSGDDRILGVEPGEPGMVSLAGSSNSEAWLRESDPYGVGGGQDGFLLTATFPALRLSRSTGIYVGQDLQTTIELNSVFADETDGIVMVRSSDPSKLLVSSRPEREGSAEILLSDSAQTGSITLQALASDGEVDVVFESRAGASSNVWLARKRLRVRLAPSALFFDSRAEVLAQVKTTIRVGFQHGPILPDGTRGPAQRARTGVVVNPSISSSDPDGLYLPRNSEPSQTGQGSYFVDLMALREGVYTLSLHSPRIPAGADERRMVRTVDSGPALFTQKNFLLPKDHVASITVHGDAGDSLQFSSEDPGRLRLGPSSSTATNASAAIALARSGSTIWFAAMDREGIVAVHVEGTYQGAAVREKLIFRLTSYSAVLQGAPSVTGVGRAMYLTLALTAQIPSDGSPEFAGPSGIANPLVFSGLQLRSSDSAVIAPTGANSLRFTLTARGVGSTILDFDPALYPELAAARALVEVVPAYLGLGAAEILIPAGTEMALPISTNGDTEALKQVRLRLSRDAPFQIRSMGGDGLDVTVNFLNHYAVILNAQEAAAGVEATLFISAPGVPEYPVPIRVVQAVLLPRYEVIRVKSGGSDGGRGVLDYRVAGYDAGKLIELLSPATFPKANTVRTIVDPPGICVLPEAVELRTLVSPGLSFQCSGAGKAVVALSAAPGIAEMQPQLTVRIIARPADESPRLPATRILTGNGLQVPFSLFTGSWNSPFRGTITSADPERVRVSLNPKAAGTASVTTNSAQPAGAVYVQGYASAGVVPLLFESVEGGKTEVSVYLFPSTMALRRWDTDVTDSPGTIDWPLSQPDRMVNAAPYLVEPASGKLIPVTDLQRRGGAEPVFLKGESSDSSAITSIPPNALVNEGDTVTQLAFRATATGETVLSCSQPEGFVSVPGSTLRVRIVKTALKFQYPVVLSADMQVPVSIAGVGDSYSRPSTVTVTSHNPGKLLLSRSNTAIGEPVVTVNLGAAIYAQAMSNVIPGEKLVVRLEAEGWAASDAAIEIMPAELQSGSPNSVHRISPGQTSSYVNLLYGPVTREEWGRVSSTFNGTMRPGVNIPLQVTSSDSGVIDISKPSLLLDHLVQIPLRAVRPGSAQIRVEAPDGIVNRAQQIEALVEPFAFRLDTSSTARYTVSPFFLNNPRNQKTVATIRSTGAVPLRFGLSPSGPAGSSADSLILDMAPNERRAFYVEPAGAGGSAMIQTTADDFDTQAFQVYVGQPQILFNTQSLNLSVTNGVSTVAVLLRANFSAEAPLGTTLGGPLRIQAQSSNPQVVQVAAAPIEILPGESRKTLAIHAIGRGEAIIRLTAPDGFEVGDELRVTVR